MQQADAGREPFVRVGEALLERVRAVARRIAERVRRLAGDESAECAGAQAAQSIPHETHGPDEHN